MRLTSREISSAVNRASTFQQLLVRHVKRIRNLQSRVLPPGDQLQGIKLPNFHALKLHHSKDFCLYSERVLAGLSTPTGNGRLANV